jgi:peptide/nickel transport system substrate-binding protein
MRVRALAAALTLALVVGVSLTYAQENPRVGGVLKVASMIFIKQDAYERTKTLSSLEPRIVKPRGWAVAVMSHKSGLMTNRKIRQAFQAALDMEPIMAGAMGHKDFYRLDPALFFPEQPWHSTVSANLQVLDWAALNARAEKADQWDVASTGFVFSADPANHVASRCTFWGSWCNEDKERLLADMRAESDPKKRKAIVERVQTIFYEDVGHVKLGDYFTLDMARRELRGDFRTAPRLYFWNSWLAR